MKRGRGGPFHSEAACSVNEVNCVGRELFMGFSQWVSGWGSPGAKLMHKVQFSRLLSVLRSPNSGMEFLWRSAQRVAS